MDINGRKKWEPRHPSERKGKHPKLSRISKERGGRAGLTGYVGYSERVGHAELYAKEKGKSNTESVAQQIADAMNPDKQSRPGVVITDTHEAMEIGKGVVSVKYLRVVQRTEKALLISFGAFRRWLPKQHLTFKPGCWVEMPIWLSKRHDIKRREEAARADYPAGLSTSLDD